MSRRFLLAMCLIGAACGSGSPASPTPTPAPVTMTTTATAYLNEVVDAMQLHSVNRLVINWTSFRAQVLAAAPSAQTVSDAYPAISVALGLLDDHHSAYRKTGNAGYITNPKYPAGCQVPAVDDAVAPGDVGYLRIGAFSGDSAAEIAFATDLQSRISAQDRAGLAGWIVDLRGNGGGDVWPMLAGVGPILGAGTAGYFVAPGNIVTPWGYASGGSFSGSSIAVPLSYYQLISANPRVAVLTDQAVASSGEAIVVAFRGRPDTRSFGAPTCGVPTANASYSLSDGATLILTTAVDADRNRVTYNSSIAPDEALPDATSTVERAINWIRGG